jgi:tRNA(Ile)-lysidine synthase
VSDPLAERVRAHCHRHALLPRGARVLALVSGGADSMCLMHLLPALHDGPVEVLTVDHGLRPEAAREAAAVLAAARDLGLPAHLARLGLAAGPGAPDRARRARRDAARRVAAERGCDRIATGHTLSDQAETVLMRLARGAGRTGGMGMAPSGGAVVRPLLGTTRAEARAWCRERGIPFVDDPANDDPRLTRARARHGLLPALAGLHPGAEGHVAAFADRLRDEAEVLDALVDAAWARVAEGEGASVRRLAAEPAAVGRLLVRRMATAAGLPGDALAAGPVDRVLGAAAAGRRVDVPGGFAAVARGVLIVCADPGPAPAEAPLCVPGEARFGGLTLRAARSAAGDPAPGRVWVAAEGPLVVRGPRPGDRIAMRGGGRQRVGRLLAAAGVPSWLRDRVPVVCAGERVLWVAGHRADARALAAPGAPAVRLEAEGWAA